MSRTDSLGQQDRLLLSWRSVLNLSLSTKTSLTQWLDRRLATGSVLVTQASIVCASARFKSEAAAEGLNTAASFERFVANKIHPAIVVPIAHISMSLYSELIVETGSEDLELLSLACALQNGYKFQCWDKRDVKFAQKLHRSVLMSDYLLKNV